jgi:ubiquinone/menaquinone biosynthesis C-methylase UbiE
MAHQAQFPASERHRLVDEERQRRQPVEMLLARIRPRKGEAIADLGAGVGYLSLPLAAAGAEVIALDSQQEMLEGLRERGNGSERVQLVRAILPSIPLRDASLDRVVMVNVLHEVEDKAGLAKEIARVLRPTGRMTLVDWQARETGRGPPLHERVPVELAPSIFEGFVLERGYDDGDHYHLELRRE